MFCFIYKINNKYKTTGTRSKETLNNIALSLVTRAANIIAHLLVVPLTIDYLNPERYGIWLTLSSVIAWVSFLDLGLSNGFRNRFAEAKAKENFELARIYVSTTYCVVSIIIAIALIIILIANMFLDWSELLHVDISYKEELTFVFAVVIIFTCLNMVVNIFSTLLAADQKVGIASIIQAVGQYLSLFVIYILSKYSDGSLSLLALYYSGVPCLVMLLVSIYMFYFSRYRQYRPSIKMVEFSLTKKIMNLGIQFFIIQLCMIAIFQVINIVISRELGPECVTQYNIANKYFNVIYMTVVIVITPLWSAFTDAYTKEDFAWMKSIYNKLLKCLPVVALFYFILLLISKPLYHLWIGESVIIGFDVSSAMMIQVFAQTYCAMNIYIINGIGKVRIQTFAYVIISLFFWWALTMVSSFGLVGVIILTSVIYFFIGFLGHLQLYKILNKTAKGIWLK